MTTIIVIKKHFWSLNLSLHFTFYLLYILSTWIWHNYCLYKDIQHYTACIVITIIVLLLLIGQFPIIIVVSGAVPVLLIVCLFILFSICCVLIVKRRRASNEDELYTNPNPCYCTVNNITRTNSSSRFIHCISPCLWFVFSWFLQAILWLCQYLTILPMQTDLCSSLLKVF